MLGYIEFLQKFLMCISDLILMLVLLQFTILPSYYTIEYFQCKQQYEALPYCASVCNEVLFYCTPSLLREFAMHLDNWPPVNTESNPVANL